ncbi:MAG: hypothetical protein PHG61_02255 [Candidatus Marinimicrobia bacterium]|nr:hypothetical protein [Candidatus Neomarinimicrobiota bacterium]
MSDWLNAINLTIAEPGVGFAGTNYSLAKEGIVLKALPYIIDKISSSSEEPHIKVSVGNGIELRAVLSGVTIFPADREVRLEKMVNKDVAFKVRKDDSTYRYFFITAVTISKQWDLAFPGGGSHYVPILMNTTDESILDILAEDEILGEDSGLVPDEFELLTEEDQIITGFIHAT